jgi:hypothetical protein
VLTQELGHVDAKHGVCGRGNGDAGHGVAGRGDHSATIMCAQLPC